MKGILNKFGFNTLLLKITSFNSLSVFIQVSGGLLISKLIAIFLGEKGMALLGYLRNFFTSVQSIGSLGFNNGIVKYVASSSEENSGLSRLLSTAVYLSLGASILCSLSLYIGASYWNDLIFNSEYNYSIIFRCLALLLPFITLNILMIAIINGNSAYRKVIIINICSNLLSIALTTYLILTKKIEGALLAIVIAPALGFLVTLFFIGAERRFFKLILIKEIRFSALKKLGSYSIMAVFSMIVLPLVYIAIRNSIEINPGYWDAMTRISGYYMRFVATLMTLYILPQLSRGTSNYSFRKEVFGFYKTILPLFGLGLVGLFLFKETVIKLLYTQEFAPMATLFKWQLLGDLFKVASIVIGYQIIAKNMLKLFLITEVISLVVIYITSIYFVRNYGFEGAAMGHCVSYLIHLCMLLFIFRQPLFGKLNSVDE